MGTVGRDHRTGQLDPTHQTPSVTPPTSECAIGSIKGKARSIEALTGVSPLGPSHLRRMCVKAKACEVQGLINLQPGRPSLSDDEAWTVGCMVLRRHGGKWRLLLRIQWGG